MVWRTKALFVLYFALLATIVLFALGFFYPVSATDLNVDPIKPIIMGDENFYILPLAVLSLGILFWGYTQYQSGFPSAKVKHVLLTLLVYGLCFFVIAAITAPAFYLGVMMRTGYCLIEEKDIRYWEENDYFLYGFVLKESDSNYVKLDSNNFREREEIFRKLKEGEDDILSIRYSNYLLDSCVHWGLCTNDVAQAARSYISSRSYLSVALNGLWWSDLGLSFVSDVSYRRARIESLNSSVYNSFRTHNSVEVLQDEELTRALHEQGYETYETKEESNTRKFILDYTLYYEKQRPHPSAEILLKYNISIKYDSIYIQNAPTTVPLHIYQMEDAIRSVHHAQQYLREWIFLRDLRVLACFLPLLSLLFFAAPYLSFRAGLGVVVVGGMLGTGLLTVFELDKLVSSDGTLRNGSSYLALPLLGLLFLTWSALRKTLSSYVSWGFHLVVLGMAWILFFAIMGNKWAFAEDSLEMGKPVDLAFFGVQVVGLAGVLLMVYLQALPKRV